MARSARGCRASSTRLKPKVGKRSKCRPLRTGLFTELPGKLLLGNSSLRWVCSRTGLFFLFVA
jgi:hypothetical protein